MTGIIKWLKGNLSFGFIGRDGADDVYFKTASVLKEHQPVNLGDKVEFEIAHTARCDMAVNIRMLKRAKEKPFTPHTKE